MKQPIGIALIVMVPCAIIIVLEIIKIVNVFGAERKQKIKEEHDRQQSEIDELKRQLAMLASGIALENTPNGPTVVETQTFDGEAPVQAENQQDPENSGEDKFD
jgi:hypothetical protein